MNILILTNFHVGLYQFRRELLEALLRKHAVGISLPDGALVRPLEAMGCRFFHTPMERRGINPITDGKLCFHYLRLIRAEKPDLVISYTIKPNIYGGLVCRLRKIPYAANITGLGTAFQKDGLLRRMIVTLYKLALKEAKTVFFENRANMALFVQERIVPEARCCLLNGAGVNLQHYPYTPYPQGDTTRFLFIGRIMKEKGIEELFAVMERLWGEGVDCCLDLLGGCEEDYSQAIQRGEAQGWLHWHGYVPDVRPHIANSHCFVLPSYHEGMANTNLECAAMGRPLITSSIPGCREAVLEGSSGLLCQAKSVDSLYCAMKAFLALNREARAEMGRAGRAHMENRFDKQNVVEKTMHALNL